MNTTQIFIPCLAGGTTAEFIANHASKGDYICVSGRMQNNNFTRDDGSTNYGQQLIVRNFDANTLFAANKTINNHNNAVHINKTKTTYHNNKEDKHKTVGNNSNNKITSNKTTRSQMLTDQ